MSEATPSSIQEATILDAIQSKTVTLLVESYGFELEKSVEAVLAIGDPSDAGLAVSWLLDNGEEDKGGAVEFIHCPHLDDALATPLVDGLHLPRPRLGIAAPKAVRPKRIGFASPMEACAAHDTSTSTRSSTTSPLATRPLSRSPISPSGASCAMLTSRIRGSNRWSSVCKRSNLAARAATRCVQLRRRKPTASRRRARAKARRQWPSRRGHGTTTTMIERFEPRERICITHRHGKTGRRLPRAAALTRLLVAHSEHTFLISQLL